jgi:enolase
MGKTIKSIVAEEIFAEHRGHVALRVVVTTEDGAQGIHVPVMGVSTGQYEASFLFDGGARWFGRGLLQAVEHVNAVIAPQLEGMKVTHQRAIDEAMIELDGTLNKSRLGANAIAGVSIAVLKAAAHSSRLPLYRYIGGVDACTLPCPIIGCGTAGTYRDPGQTRLYKPSFEYAAFGATTFSHAVYVTRCVQAALEKIMRKRHRLQRGRSPLSGVQDDREALQAMTEAIDSAGYTGKVGIFIDCAAGCYYEPDKETYVGLFSKSERTRQDLMELYKDFIATYPIVVLEDPFHEDDFQGHALLRREVNIEIVGDDLFVTNPRRLQQGIEVGAANAMVVKIPQIGTVSEAMDAAQLAQSHGYGVGPCSSRGDPSADFAVGLNTGQMRGNLNRALQIERELGDSAKFRGRDSFKSG